MFIWSPHTLQPPPRPPTLLARRACSCRSLRPDSSWRAHGTKPLLKYMAVGQNLRYLFGKVTNLLYIVLLQGFEMFTGVPVYQCCTKLPEDQLEKSKDRWASTGVLEATSCSLGSAGRPASACQRDSMIAKPQSVPNLGRRSCVCGCQKPSPATASQKHGSSPDSYRLFVAKTNQETQNVFLKKMRDFVRALERMTPACRCESKNKLCMTISLFTGLFCKRENTKQIRGFLRPVAQLCSLMLHVSWRNPRFALKIVRKM